LKLDPKSAETVERKMQTLQTAVGTATQKVALLRQKQDEANKAFQRGGYGVGFFRRKRQCERYDERRHDAFAELFYELILCKEK
jgi:hypothetical protein